jgi:hypothetical protein
MLNNEQNVQVCDPAVGRGRPQQPMIVVMQLVTKIKTRFC